MIRVNGLHRGLHKLDFSPHDQPLYGYGHVPFIVPGVADLVDPVEELMVVVLVDQNDFAQLGIQLLLEQEGRLEPRDAGAQDDDFLRAGFHSGALNVVHAEPRSLSNSDPPSSAPRGERRLGKNEIIDAPFAQMARVEAQGQARQPARRTPYPCWASSLRAPRAAESSGPPGISP